MTWTRGRVQIILYDMMTRVRESKEKCAGTDTRCAGEAQQPRPYPTLYDFVSREVPRSGCVLEFQRRVPPARSPWASKVGGQSGFFFLFHSASDRQVAHPIQADRDTI
jgi:hypothetical protein